MSRQWQAFNTRYNVYFNGHEHYVEQLKAMEKAYEDDYSRMLLTHPAEARGDQKRPQPSGDFKRTIEKMQKSIQLHSIKKKPAKKSGSPKEKAFRAREEFNPFLHNAWMTMGRAQFYGGDFLGAASTFLYVSKHFPWLPAVTVEARIWQARSYCALDWLYEAENILTHIKATELTSSSLESQYALACADWLTRAGRWQDAVNPLIKAVKGASGSQKNRLWFLLGQVYVQLGDRQRAYDAFRHAGAGASTAYRTKFNARIKQSEVFAGKDIRGEVKALRAMARYERNKEYLDQIYYAIGNLYLSRGDSAHAVENYRTAVDKSTRNGIDKGLANLALGGIYFDWREYVKAQPCYSEAIPQLPETYPGYNMLKKRADVLDELAVYAGNVELQDSLLDLSKLSEEEQMKVCQRLADELKKREKEEAEAAAREEYLDKNKDANDRIGKDSPSSSFQMNTDKSWYFYNTMAKNQGKTEFQRRWGSRKLEDDWRRRNKTSFAFSSDEETTEEPGSADTEQTDSVGDAKALADDPHNAEYYFAQIPKTPEQIQTANDVIQEGLYNMGVILKDRLEDFPAARREFDRLDTRYPDNVYRLDVYYNMYLMAVREDDHASAETWRNRILSDFPESPYGLAMRDPAYFDNLRRMHQIQEELYAQTYADYLDNRNAEVHRATEEMQRDFPLSPILPKFVFIDALSYLTEGNAQEFKDRLTHLLQKWPDTDMTDMAGAILRGLEAGRQPHAGGSNSRGMIWQMRLSDTDAPATADGRPANFENDPESPQYLVFAFARDSISANRVLYDVARFNFSSFVVMDFDLEPMSFGNVGLLVVKGFKNQAQAAHYLGVLETSEYRVPEGVTPIMISKPNFELLLREGRSFEDYFRFQQEAAAGALPEQEEEKSTDTEDDKDAAEPEPEGSDGTARQTVNPGEEELQAEDEAPQAETSQEEQPSITTE